MVSIFYDIAAAVRDAVATGLETTPAGRPGDMRICIVPGQPAWDSCECGTLLISVSEIFYSRSFPAKAQPIDDGCTPFIVADMMITLLRCAPGPNERGLPPTCEQLDVAASDWFADMDSVRETAHRALQTLADANTILNYALREQVAAGPQGGCVGHTFPFFVSVTNRWGPC